MNFKVVEIKNGHVMYANIQDKKDAQKQINWYRRFKEFGVKKYKVSIL